MKTACSPSPIPAPPSRPPVELFRRARKLMRLFDLEGYERAAALFQKVLELSPDYAPACSGLAETYSYWGFRRELNGQECRSYYDLSHAFAVEALRLAPERADSHRGMAVSLRRGGKSDPERAKQEARLALDLDPNDAEAWHQSWRAFGCSLADRSIQKALELDPSLCSAENDLAVALCESGRLDEALAHLMAALRVNPRNSLVLYNLAMVLDRRDARTSALAVMRKARLMHPDDALLEYGWDILGGRSHAA